MNRFRLFGSLLAGLVAALCLPSLHAALEFEASEVTVKPVPGGPRKLTAEFKFTNTGTEPVSIIDVHSGCGCTVPQPPKEPIAPGGSGVIPVTYSAGERQGRQTQTIQVKTSDDKEFALMLVADLPVRVTFTPRLLLLGRGDSGSKTATVTFGEDLPLTLTEVVSDVPAFEFTETPKLDGAVLKLQVRYAGDAAADGRGVIRIRTKGQSGTEYTDLLYVRYRP